ncbi:hypothetical protein [Actinoplanes sp. L3-i22]|uniref:hypothetical protein n=1 Tax=Actinoplanes sp. L3-i22 TaxID=2836373 RepID=UPI001C861DBA|nr:hypothetical protein [Actinoplanes sp. L3-i22]
MERGPMALFGAIVAVGLGPALWLGVQLSTDDVPPRTPPATIRQQLPAAVTDQGGYGAGEESDDSTGPALDWITPSAAAVTTSSSPSPSASASPSVSPSASISPSAPVSTEPTGSAEPSTPPAEPSTEPTGDDDGSEPPTPPTSDPGEPTSPADIVPVSVVTP